MARLNRLSRIRAKSSQEPAATEPKLVAIKSSTQAPHRRLSLLAITIILNTLLWSSILCSIIAFFQIASDSKDGSNILPGALTLVSAIVTITYTIVHTTYSAKQRALTYQQPDATTIKKTTYIANRLVVSLCVLWLLTAGWNMILVARRPSCLPNQLDGQSWEAGITCLFGRVGMSLAMIALVASLTLFGMMAAVRRPFEAHLFACGQRQPNNSELTSPASRGLSEDHAATGKLVPESGMSAYNHQRSTSTFTNADVDTLGLNASSRPASIVQSPSPTRDRVGVFTSLFAPLPLPPAFMISVESPSLQSQSPASDPFADGRRLSLTPCTDALLTSAAYVPYSIPIKFSASAQRAVYPDAAAPYRSISTSRSQPHPHPRSMSSFSNRHCYARSSVSLSRPHRLSSLTPVPHLECSSRSDTLNSFSASPGQARVQTPSPARRARIRERALRRSFTPSQTTRPSPAPTNQAPANTGAPSAHQTPSPAHSRHTQVNAWLWAGSPNYPSPRLC
ncbi:hypothetical protein BU25DRAFT_92736 [Macroventuria anomochaeta]|uniref:Uncharacterized protein n=1 Tax=Macroventuria anomochaeta TaxID=301207 RepID=A0ACB6RY86_9PLEO|nr:uncharacterized protein BU25DRAFT_92736 [Macroventuria anomochaeta]KAF2626683.1 hypothetical protein BU25DRAFT_92736 [Macroventuria anomochaeta]